MASTAESIEAWPVMTMTVAGRSRRRISRIKSRPSMPGWPVEPGQAEVGEDDGKIPLDQPLQRCGPIMGHLDPSIGLGE